MKTDRPSKKMDWKNAKYTVTELIGSHAVRLNTPPGPHNVFHMLNIQRSANDPLPSQIVHKPQLPAIIDNNGQEVYYVDKILRHKHNKSIGKVSMLVKWSGYEKLTWELVTELIETDALQTYLSKHEELKNSLPSPTEGERG